MEIAEPRCHSGSDCKAKTQAESARNYAAAILLAVIEQETLDRLAVLAKPHFSGLLRLRSARHIYEPTPGTLNSKVVVDGHTLTLDKLKRASQPYRHIERFLSTEKIMQYIIGPGVLPVVTALSKEIMGKKV